MELPTHEIKLDSHDPTQLRHVASDDRVVRHLVHPKNSAAPFAGRLGGNLEFTTSPSLAKDEDLPIDASPYFSWRSSFDLKGFLEPTLYKAALIEAWATGMLVYLTGLIAVAGGDLVPTLSTGALVPAILGAITNMIVLTLFIFAAGPVSGGHLNPLITITTFFLRLASFPRTVLYVCFQTAGATVGGLLLGASIGTRDFTFGGGCYIDQSLISLDQALAIEFTSSMALIFVATGVGLDPRQKAIFGPALAPTLVGAALLITSFASGYVLKGYGGASMNPARCFGLYAGSHFQSYHWIQWVGPICAAMVNGAFYYVIPPYSD